MEERELVITLSVLSDEEVSENQLTKILDDVRSVILSYPQVKLQSSKFLLKKFRTTRLPRPNFHSKFPKRKKSVEK